MPARTLARVLVSLVLVSGTAMVVAPIADADHRTRDINLQGRFTEFRDVRQDPDGAWSKGDRMDFRFLLRERRGDPGDGDGTCIVTRTHDGKMKAADCELVFALPDGRLHMRGEVTDEHFDGRRAVTVRLTEGTRHYTDAAGTVTLAFTSQHERGERGFFLFDLLGDLLGRPDRDRPSDFAAMVEFER